MAPAHLVVETNGKQCGVRQEEEYDDERMEVVLSFIDPEGAGNACSLYRGSSTHCSERLDHEGALMVNFKGTCAAIEQYEPFKELKGLSFFRTVGRRTDGWAGALGRRWLGLTHGRTVRRWTLGHREGACERSDGRTDMRDGRSGGRWTCGRLVGHQSVRRSEERGVGRADGRSIEQNSRGGRTHGPTADGRNIQTVEKGSGQKDGPCHGRAGRSHGRRSGDSRKDGRKNGRADGRSHGLGHDQSQGSVADRTPDRAMGKSKERQEQTPTDVLCAWMQRSAAPAGQFRDGSQPCPTGWRALQTSSRLSQRLSKRLGSIIPASATAKDGESAEKQGR